MTAHSAMLFFLGPEPELVFGGFKVAPLSASTLINEYYLDKDSIRFKELGRPGRHPTSRGYG